MSISLAKALGLEITPDMDISVDVSVPHDAIFNSSSFSPSNKGIPHTEEWKTDQRQRAINNNWADRLPVMVGNQHAKGNKPNQTSFKKGQKAWNEGLPQPHSADNARKSAHKIRAVRLGMKRQYQPNGSFKMIRPEAA